MRHLIVAAGFFAALAFAPAASAQQFLGQSRTVSAYAQTYEPFYDNITVTDSDSDGTTATGNFSSAVSAATDFLTTDFGMSTADQTGTINAAAKTFNASGSSMAGVGLYYGADSLATGESTFELTFKLNRKGKLNLLGTMQAAVATEGQGGPELTDGTYASLVVTNATTGAVVYSKRMNVGESIDLEDGLINLNRGTYKVTITAYSAHTTGVFGGATSVATFAQFDITGTVTHN